MSLPNKLIVLWILVLIGMILHFNYHVSELFYGIDITREGATGKVPATAHVIKNIFYHVPLLVVISLLYLDSRVYRLMLFVLGIGFTIAHTSHLIGEFRHSVWDLSQLPLLTIVLLVSLLINQTSWDYYRSIANT